jgi:tRNA-modifying protein YgfZ
VSLEQPMIDFSNETYFTANPYGSVVRCEGEDTKSFLHRMSTQDLHSLNDGEGTLNAYVNQKGRLIDLTYHLQIDKNTAILLGQNATGEKFIQWLDQFHFIEKIEFADLSSVCNGLLVAGRDATAIIQKLTSSQTILAPWQFVQKDHLLVTRIFDYQISTLPQVPCYYLCDISNTPVDLGSMLADMGALPMDKTTEESLRVFSGIPRVPNEINESLTPLALGLHDGISWSKGCYIGQEVIARMDTYDRITKNLTLFALEASSPIPLGAAMMRGDKVVGEITSVTAPQHGQQQGLALIKLKEHEIQESTFNVKVEDTSWPAVPLRRSAAQQPHD